MRSINKSQSQKTLLTLKTLKIVNRLERIQNLTPEEKRNTAVAFNNSKQVIGCITDYLEYECGQIDKQLADPAELYSNGKSGQYVAFLLAERATLVKLNRFLTLETNIDGDQP